MSKIIAVCGVKNSGKTTLIRRLTEYLAGKGLRVAVIKHDGHDFTCDIPGTDTWQFTEAGAYASACFSDQRVFIHRRGSDIREKELIRLFPEADIIFLEGLKESSYPKIEVIRKENGNAPVSNPTGRFLIVSDRDSSDFSERALAPEDIPEIAAAIDAFFA